MFGKENSLEEFLKFRPLHPGDPGPEIYQAILSLPEERQRVVAGVISEAVGQIATIKGSAYSKIGGILAGSGREQV